MALDERAYMIVSLDGPLSLLMHQRWALYAAVWIAVGAMCAAYAWVDLKRGRVAGERRALSSELASLSMVSVATLLVAYHRYYDATLLLFPLALAIALLAGDGARRRAGLVTLALLAPLMAPLPATLVRLDRAGIVPEAVAESLPWKVLALGSHTWLLVVCWAMLRDGTRWRDPESAKLRLVA
jgi:hypothetical protein